MRHLPGLTVTHAICAERFNTVLLNNHAAGLCGAPSNWNPGMDTDAPAVPPQVFAEQLIGQSVDHILPDLFMADQARKVLALAVLNVLTETLWRTEGPPAGTTLISGDAFCNLRIAA